MADRIFTVDTKDVDKLVKFYKRAPRMFANATGSMLNDFAFGVRNTAIEVIHEKMTVRSSQFVISSMKAKKTHKRLPIGSQESEAGSVERKRSTGWKEQQLGTKTARERTITLLGRRKSAKRKLIGPARFKPGSDMEIYKKYPGSGPEQRNTIMMQKLDRKRWRKPFVIVKKKGMTSGVYKFLRRKPKLLQVIKSEDVQPEKIPWMLDAVDRYFKREDLPRLWGRTLQRILKFT